MHQILIVEDDSSMRENIHELLIMNDYDCITAENGVDALNKLKHTKVDLIISDLMMPKLDGYGLFRILQDNPSHSTTPFVFLTAKADAASHREGMNLGVDDYITKPFKADDLMNAIKVRLDKYKKQNEKYELLENNISKYIPHELRTPLGVIIGFSDLILDGNGDLTKEEIVEMVQRIKRSGQRLHHRIKKLILLTEIELDIEEKSRKGGLFKESINCDNDLIFEIISETINYYERKEDITFDFDSAELRINDFYFKRLLIEIVDNAFKFSKPSEKVNFHGIKLPLFYEIKIIDHGSGMSEEEIRKLSPFNQFNRQLYQQEGNGLGLHIVNKIVKLFDGEWEISARNKGATTITIRLKYKIFSNKSNLLE